MRCPHGVEARLFQQTSLAPLGITIGRRTQRAIVMVQAGTIQLDGLPVETQSVACVIVDGTYAEGLLYSVFPSLLHTASKLVEIWRFGRP